jgi:hypothetical protein
MTAVYCLGLSALNLRPIAEQLLRKWKNAGCEPTIGLDKISRGGTQICDDGGTIERSTPGFSIADDDLPTKLALVRRKAFYRSISQLLDMASLDNGTAVICMKRCFDIYSFLSLAGFETEIVAETIGLEGCSHWATISDDCTDLSLYPWRKGCAGRIGDTKIKLAGQANAVLADQYERLRSELLCQSTERS